MIHVCVSGFHTHTQPLLRESHCAGENLQAWKEEARLFVITTESSAPRSARRILENQVRPLEKFLAHLVGLAGIHSFFFFFYFFFFFFFI